jgi:hypothetical protein
LNGDCAFDIAAKPGTLTSFGDPKGILAIEAGQRPRFKREE